MNRISPLWEINSEEAHVSHILSLSLWVNCLSHFTKLVDACVRYIIPNIFKSAIYKKKKMLKELCSMYKSQCRIGMSSSIGGKYLKHLTLGVGQRQRQRQREQFND